MNNINEALEELEKLNNELKKAEDKVQDLKCYIVDKYAIQIYEKKVQEAHFGISDGKVITIESLVKLINRVRG